jgi:rare lipoprotein A
MISPACRSGALRTLLMSLVVAGCSGVAVRDSAPPEAFDANSIPDAVPRVEAPSRYGNGPVYQVNGDTYRVLPSSTGYAERGVASWYGTKFHGRRTSSGETYDMYAMTAAHTSLPLPTYARVTNLQNGKSVVVRINDRGPFHENRLIDLSYAAATKLEITGNGTGLVEVRALDPAADAPAPVPASAPAESPPTLYVQLGAFADAGNAQRMAEKLKTHGYTPRVTPTQQGSTTMHRVRLGPLRDVSAADDLVRQLLRLGFSQRHLVVD